MRLESEDSSRGKRYEITNSPGNVPYIYLGVIQAFQAKDNFLPQILTTAHEVPR